MSTQQQDQHWNAGAKKQLNPGVKSSSVCLQSQEPSIDNIMTLNI